MVHQVVLYQVGYIISNSFYIFKIFSKQWSSLKERSVKFCYNLLSVLLLECLEWSAVPIMIPTCLRRGLHGCFFCSECCTGGESTAAPRVKYSLAHTHQRQARGCIGHKYCFSCVQVWPNQKLNLVYQLWWPAFKQLGYLASKPSWQTTRDTPKGEQNQV